MKIKRLVVKEGFPIGAYLEVKLNILDWFLFREKIYFTDDIFEDWFSISGKLIRGDSWLSLNLWELVDNYRYPKEIFNKFNQLKKEFEVELGLVGANPPRDL